MVTQSHLHDSVYCTRFWICHLLKSLPLISLEFASAQGHRCNQNHHLSPTCESHIYNKSLWKICVWLRDQFLSVGLPSVHVTQAKRSLVLCMTLPTLTKINSKIATWFNDSKARPLNGRLALGPYHVTAVRFSHPSSNWNVTSNKDHTSPFQVSCILHFKRGCNRWLNACFKVVCLLKQPMLLRDCSP